MRELKERQRKAKVLIDGSSSARRLGGLATRRREHTTESKLFSEQCHVPPFLSTTFIAVDDDIV